MMDLEKQMTDLRFFAHSLQVQSTAMNENMTVSVIRYDNTRKPFVFDASLLPPDPSTYAKYIRPKPFGLWLSVGDAWKRFVRSEMLEASKTRWRFAHRFTIDKRDLVCVETVSEASELFAKFGQFSPTQKIGNMTFRSGLIDWSKVARANPDKCGVLVMFSRIRGEMSTTKEYHDSWIYGWDSDSVVLYRAPRTQT